MTALFRTTAHVIQLREKDLDRSGLRSLAVQAAELAMARRKLFLLNSDFELAVELGADGVHLTSRQTPGPALELRSRLDRAFMVGQSVHSFSEAVQASTLGVDYVLLGPVAPPISKPSEAPALGWEELRKICEAVSVPVIALGGLTAGVFDQALAAGAAGVAGISWVREEIGRILARPS